MKTALLAALKLPVLMIAGDADLYAPPGLMRRMADHIKGVQFVVVPEAGHSVWWEASDPFNTAVLKFIARH
jgi:pimeloyl-ACP methyl ester carboxylesterase